MKPWHLKKPDLLSQVRSDLRPAFPNLHVFLEDTQVFVRGSFPVVHESRTLARYSIEIELLQDYPDSIPLVKETENRIPRTVDHHINGRNGDICLFVTDERWRIWPVGASFLDFLKVPVHNYFLSESFVEMGWPRPFGERSHGAAGILEYYAEELSTSDQDTIVRFIQCLSKMPVGGHYPCPCGCGKKLRQCHQEKLWQLHDRIPPSVALRSLQMIKRECVLL